MSAGVVTASLRRIWGLMYRHISLYRASWPRLLELAYWPTLQLCIWGFTASFFAGRLGNPGIVAAGALLGGVLLWEVALRTQMGLSMAFLEEIWSRNLGHIFVSPLRPWELLAAMVGVSALRVVLGLVPAVLLAWLLYDFDVFSIGFLLIPFVANLLVMGWWVALGVMCLLLRYGAGAEALAWTVLFGMTPFSAVFYPVSILPKAVQPIALALPSAHVFEGMRAAINHGVVDWPDLAWATGLNALWLGAATLLFTQQFRAARTRGALISIGE